MVDYKVCNGGVYISTAPLAEVHGFPGFDPLSEDEILKKNRAWRLPLEEAAGTTFKEHATNLFESKGFGNLDGETFEKVLNQHLVDTHGLTPVALE